MTSVALTPVMPARLARAVIAHHSKSFALASKLLPAASRDDTFVLYAWCRHVDDSVDEATRPTVPPAIEAAFRELQQRRRIPDVYPRELHAGMAMDANGTHYASVDDLIGYAYRVAGVVGLMMCHVLGVADDAALVPAVHLGIAMQLTNVCRDVAEDRQRGRLYIPDELLGTSRGLSGAVRELLALADRYYQSADRGLRYLPWRAALGVRCARDVYSAIGDRIARANYDVDAGRAVVSRNAKLGKLGLATLRMATALPRRMVARQRYALPTRTLELADVPRL